MKYKAECGERKDGSSWISITSEKGHMQFDVPDIDVAFHIGRVFEAHGELLQSLKLLLAESREMRGTTAKAERHNAVLDRANRAVILNGCRESLCKSCT